MLIQLRKNVALLWIFRILAVPVVLVLFAAGFMQIIWNAGHPITGQQVLGQITEQYKGSWHPRTIYLLMRKLSEKGMIRDVGSARVGKVYARQFLPAISRPEYMALRIMETLPEAELPQFLSYFSY